MRNNEVLPCLVNLALKLNRTYGEPPVLDGFAYRPGTGIARNQPPGLRSDVQRSMCFKAPILPRAVQDEQHHEKHWSMKMLILILMIDD